jgi:SAM-dependent methyltransferase
VALYDAIAAIYDPWSRSVTEDIEFYVEEAARSRGPVVELAVGTGRIAVPIAAAGIPLIGIDQSPEMLSHARAFAHREGVEDLLDLRLGDIRNPPVEERVPLVICPFRSLLHMPTPAEKLAALKAAAGMLRSDGRVIFDVFEPTADDIADTNGRWLEREPGIFERADWDEASRTLSLSVRSGDMSATFDLHWLPQVGWEHLVEEAGLQLEVVYGWFDRSGTEGSEDMIFVATRSE